MSQNDNSSSENNTSNDEVVTKRSYIKRKPPNPATDWRRRPDGTYNNNPISPTYYNDYYHEKLTHPVKCEFCNKSVVFKNYKRHIATTKKCLIIQDTLKTQDLNNK
jgi:hypothetical protein